jgi:hypothetical protein
LIAALSACAAFFAFAGVASAATYFVVETGGSDANDCTNAATPCETIDGAILQHRLSPAPDDVISVGPGDYAQNVDATDPADEGLAVRGALSGGAPATTISGNASGSSACSACIVALGASPDVNVTLENVEVTQGGADPATDLSPILVLGGSDLNTVGAFVSQVDTFAAVELCVDPGTDVVNSFLDSRGTGASGLDGCAEVDITDTGIFTDSAPALSTPGTPGETTEVTRSWLSSAETSINPVMEADDDVTVDSSLLTGGVEGLHYLGGAGDILVNNSTFDVVDPGTDETIDGAKSVLIERFGSDTIEATVDSSILVEELEPDSGSAPTTVTCVYSNIQNFSDPGDPDFTNDCVPTSGPDPNNNTFFNPEDLFEDPTGGDWSLAADSPVIDAGQPGPVPPGLSTTDFDLEPRRVPGTAATCPDGVRDQGAFEAPAVSCGPGQRTLNVATTGTGTGIVTGPGIDCGGTAHIDCSETVTDGTAIELTATATDGSSFGGFSGGGCSASPCTVTMDASKSVSAAFTDTRSGPRTLVVETSGAGTGTVTGPGIDCGGGEGHTDCSESFAAGAEIELDADPDEDSIFGRYTGAGCESNPCTVSMDTSQAVVARFQNARIPHTTFFRPPTRPVRTPVFRLRSSQPRPTFECKLDRGDWEECEQRVELEGLDPGRHRFKARATNRLGVTGPFAKARFRVRR